MSSIFISHSSRDSRVADEVRVRLAAEGYRSVFLDFDPEVGIPAGRDWEKELYARLRACHALLVLCSEHSLASRWCFAEITHAKALGKHIFPLRIDDAPVEDLLGDRQVIDARAGWEEAYTRLWNGLRSAGLDPNDPGLWNPDRPPYPGLLAFQEEDAPVFFGRDGEIRRGLDLLNQLHRFGGPRLVLMLGASGSGKSSLVRAGLLPRLGRDARAWLPLAPFRPLEHPFAELARAVAGGFGRAGKSVEWRAIHTRLLREGPSVEELRARFAEVLEELRDAAGSRESTVLVSIDQCEELLTRGAAGEAERFLAFLAALLRAPDTPLLVLGTLRSDFLGTWQEQPPLQGIPFESLPVGPMAQESLAQVIEGPARIAGVELEPGLVTAMVGETGTADGLPLLAFALRELWERDGEDGRLGLDAYRNALGGLEGSVARAAEAVLRAHVAGAGRGTVEQGTVRLSLEDEAGLREAFLSMARVGEDGRFSRRSVPWTELPDLVQGLLQRFVAARLLVPRAEGGEVEVAHEALFRAWDRLVRWLEENREFLVWRRRLGEALEEWEHRRRHPAALLAGPALAEALGWLERHEVRLTDAETGYVRASDTAAREEEVAREERRRRELEQAKALADEQARRLDAEQRRAQEQAHAARGLRLRFRIAAALALVALLASGAALLARRTAGDERDRAISLGLVPRSLGLPEARFDLALLLAVAAVKIDDNPEVSGNLLTLLQRQPRLSRILHPGGGRVAWLALTRDGRRFATVNDSGDVRLWEVETGRALGDPLGGREKGWVTSLAYSPDGRFVAITDSAGAARLWNLASPDPRPSREIPLPRRWDYQGSLAFNPDGTLLAIGSADGWVRLHKLAAPGAPGSPPGPVDSLDAGYRDGPEANNVPLIAFSPDGKRLVTATHNAGVQLWDVATRRRVWEQEISALTGVAFLLEGGQIALAGRYGTVDLVDAGTGEQRGPLPMMEGVSSLAPSRDGNQLMVGNADGTVRLWNFAGPPRLVRRARIAAFSADRRLLATVLDTTVALWDVETGRLRSEFPVGIRSRVNALGLSSDGTLIAVGTRAGTVSLWRVANAGSRIEVLAAAPGASEITALAFSPRGTYLAVARRQRGGPTLHLWSVSPLRRLADLPVPVPRYPPHAIAFSPDEAQVAAGGRLDGTVHLWNTGTRRLSAELKGSRPVRSGDVTQAIEALRFSPDGKRIVGGTFGGDVVAWGVATPEPLAAAPGGGENGGDVNSLDVSPDGEMIAAATSAGVQLLHTADLRAIGRLNFAVDATVAEVGFTPDGRVLISVNVDGFVTRSPTTVAGWIEGACRVAGRELTEDEWDRYVSSDLAWRPVCAAAPPRSR